MLSETSVPLFYPSLFVMVSDVLECFGRLVFERIKARAIETNPENAALQTGMAKTTTEKWPLIQIDEFSSRDICVEAKETCRNWFYKIACVRELLPRM